MRFFRRGQRGFTLIELMTVASILAVMSAVVVPAITGTSTASRASSQAIDINSVRSAIDQFKSEITRWPTDGPPYGSPWVAGGLPKGSGEGSGIETDPYIFDDGDITGVNFNATGSVQGVIKTFYSDYFRVAPSYSRDSSSTFSVAASTSTPVFQILKGGSSVFLRIKNNSTSALTFKVWSVDKNGEPWIFIDKDKY